MSRARLASVLAAAVLAVPALATVGSAAPAAAAAPAPGDKAAVAEPAGCTWNEGQFANGVRIRRSPSFSAAVVGLGYSSHRVLVYSCPRVTDTVWLNVRNLTTGVTGWSQQGYVWRK